MDGFARGTGASLLRFALTPVGARMPKRLHRDRDREQERSALQAPIAELKELYAQVDAEYLAYTCESSADCCQFAISGREPWLTPLEWHVLQAALLARPLPKTRLLPVLRNESTRRCPVLRDDNQCGAYLSRPFGCRTYFCDRAKNLSGGAENPLRTHRALFARLTQQIAELSAQAFPADPLPRPLTTWFSRR
jgi:uncharacterized protein